MTVEPGDRGSIPRLVIAAPQGRSGKTTLSVGLCAALAGRGLRVQPFKKGPDYIDPSWLSAAAGHPCRSLDPYFYQEESALVSAFFKGGQQADICLVEGNHGLYDGFDSSHEIPGETIASGSTAAVARALQAPVLLVVNTARMGRSIAALLLGYQMFEPETRIAGVVLNNVANSRHEARLREAIERHVHIPVVGALPRQEALAIPDRHLGLVPSGEDDATALIAACRRSVEQFIDLDLALEIARSGGSSGEAPVPALERLVKTEHPSPVDIGVFRDRVFTFYYPENLEALEEEGARLHFIDSLQDSHLPAVHGLYIGGGFPEVFMEKIAANTSLLKEVRQAVLDGMPVYAECGGMMYLGQRIFWGERSVAMAGALPLTIEMTDRPQGHGYVLAQARSDHPFLGEGATVRGHEFHNSRVTDLDLGHGKFAYAVQRGKGLGDAVDGVVFRNTVAGYTHLHVAGAPGWAHGFVNLAHAFAAGKAGTVSTPATSLD